MVAALLVMLGCPADEPGDTGAPDSEHSAPDSNVDDSGDSGPDSAETGDTAPERADADEDGYVSDADGGDDCDDNNQFRFPGATEYCDGMDHDCDGVANNGANCADWPDPALMFPQKFSDGRSGFWVDDVTGDGLADLNVYEPHSAPDDLRAQLIVPGPFDWQGIKTPQDVAVLTLVWNGGDYCGPSDSPNPGDVDGDGVNDLVLPSQSLCEPGSAVLLGPFATDGRTVGVADEMDAEWAPVDAEVKPDVWASSTFRADLNADGKQDEITNGDGETWIFYGGNWSTETESNATFVPGVEFVSAAGDLDGDGVDDLVASVYSDGIHEAGVYLLSGAYVSPGVLDVSGAATAWVSEAPTEDALGTLSGHGVRKPGEDGYGLLRIGTTHSRSEESEEEEAIYFSGNLTGGHTADDAVGGYTNMFGFSIQATDFDGDGTVDDITGAYDEAKGGYGLCVLPGDTPLPVAILTPLPERKWCLGLHGGVASLNPGPDATGDGRGDMMVAWNPDTSPDWSDMVAGLLPGFDIPWDDPEAWN